MNNHGHTIASLRCDVERWIELLGRERDAQVNARIQHSADEGRSLRTIGVAVNLSYRAVAYRLEQMRKVAA